MIIADIFRFFRCGFCLLLISGWGIFIENLGAGEPVEVVVFGDEYALAPEEGVASYPELLPDLLNRRGVDVVVRNESVAGSHSGSRLDDDTHPVAHGMERLRTRILLPGKKAPDIVVIQFGWNDSREVEGGDILESRIDPVLYAANIYSFVDRVRDAGGKVVLVSPWPAGDSDSEWQRTRTAEYASFLREFSQKFSVELVDMHAHVLQLSKISDENQPSLLPVDQMSPARMVAFSADRISAAIASLLKSSQLTTQSPLFTKGYQIPIVDLADDSSRQFLVDREIGQYLGHPTTLLLEDNKTILCVYPKGHGRGGIVYKRSNDGGKTWGNRLPVPDNWSSSREVPTLHRVVDPKGKKRIIMWSGLYPSRLAVSEDDGLSWSPLKYVGDWGGIVVMGSVVELTSGPGHYMALFHDDGRFLYNHGKRTGQFSLLKTFSRDGGLTWDHPERIYMGDYAHLCEPGTIRSPDGKTLVVLLRENSRRLNSHMIFSRDEGVTWSEPVQMPASLTGDRHTGVYTRDGRLFISFRDTALESETQGDWVAWVGTFDDLMHRREGMYRIRLKDNKHRWDCAYPGVLLLPDDTIVTTTYGHWTEGENPYVMTVRLKLSETDRILQKMEQEKPSR